MLKSVVVLTLSEKFDGYCIAVYDPSTKKMLRLVKDETRENGIPKKFAAGINLLDEVEIKVLDCCPTEHQIENVKVDLAYGLKKVGIGCDINSIHKSVPKNINVFGDTNYKLMNTSLLNHSLEIIKFENMNIQQREVNGKIKTKANFVCDLKNHNDYSVTDARFFDSNKFIKSGYAVVSLPASDSFTAQYGYFKYISAIYPD